MGIRTELNKISRSLKDLEPEIPVQYYVSPLGNDSKDGKSLDTAFKSIEKAIDVLNNLDPTIYNVLLWVAPGTYFVLSDTELTRDRCIIKAIAGLPGKTNWIGSGISGTPNPATGNGLNVKGRFNYFEGITFFANSPNWTSLAFFTQAGGGGYGGRNTVNNCYFFYGVSTAQCKHNIALVGSRRNIIKNCIFQGANTAGIWILFSIENPEDNTIENNIFIGTNRGILIQDDNYNTIIRKNLFSIGSRTDETMDNAIEITSGMSAGKIIVAGNEFEQSAINDILDNKTGGTLIEMNNFNGA